MLASYSVAGGKIGAWRVADPFWRVTLAVKKGTNYRGPDKSIL